MNSPSKSARVNNVETAERGPLQLTELRPWVVAQIWKASKLAFSNINRNRRLGLSPRCPCSGVAHWVVKTPRTQLTKQV